MKSAKTEKWFMDTLKRIMKFNEYSKEMITVEECTKKDRWTPVDLVLREYYNNGCGSSIGFLGIRSSTCLKLYDYIQDNLEDIISKDMINETGRSNWGFTLWTNYDRRRR